MNSKALEVYEKLHLVKPDVDAFAISCCKHSCTLGILDKAKKYFEISEKLVDEKNPNFKIVVYSI